MMKKLLFTFITFLSFYSVQAQTYCTAEGPLCDTQFNSFIARVALGTFSNSSNCAVNGGAVPGYSDFTALGPIVLAPEAMEVLTVTPGTPNLSDICYAYIDWNDNGDFTDPGEELVFTAGNPGAVAGDYQAQVIVPADVDTTQLFRMRIRTQDAGFETTNVPPGPCGPTDYGETEDYHIKISADIPPPPSSGYCSASGPACNTAANSWITEVAVNTATPFTNQSVCADGNPISIGYSDFTNLVITMDAGATYTITVTPGNPFAVDVCEMFADWNGDGTFDEETETIQVLNGIPGAPQGTYSGDATVPVDAFTAGLTRLRVRTYDLSAEAGLVGPCGQTAYGEVEDYSIQIINPNLPQCAENLMPADLTDPVCTNTMLSWSAPSAGAAPDGYKLYLGTDNPPTNFHNGLDVGADTNRFVQSLMPNTTYFWRVIPYINGEGDAQFCDTLEFKTSPNADPVVSIEANGIASDSVAVCDQEVLGLVAKITNGTPNYSYTWTGNNVSPTNTDSVNYAGMFTGKTDTLIVTVSDANSCSAVDTLLTYTKPLPDAGVAGTDQMVCLGETFPVSIQGYTGTIQWQDSSMNTQVWNDIAGATNDNPTFGPINEPTAYRVVLSLDGCLDTSNIVSVDLHPAVPKPTIVPSQNPFCEGDTVTLTTNNVDDNRWSTGETTQEIEVNIPGMYFVVFTDQNGCSASSDTLNLNQNPKPTPPFIVQQGDSLVASTGNGIQWFNENEGLIVGANQISHTPGDTISQNYFATITDANGCESDPSNLVFFMSTVNITELSNTDKFTVFPNPTKSNLSIAAKDQIQRIRLVSLTGSTVIQQEINSKNVKIQLEGIERGIYLLQVELNNQHTETIRVVVK